MTEGLFPADPEKALDHAELIETILEYRGEGKSVKEISELTGYSKRHVIRLIAEAAERARKENANLVARRFMEHDLRCEYLLALCSRRLKQLADLGDFDEKAVRAAVAVMDRHARLLGLDTIKRKGGRPGENDWIDNAPIKDVLAEAKALGLEIPAAFDTTTTEGRP